MIILICAPIILHDSYVRGSEKDIAPDASEVAINSVGEGQIVIVAWCIFIIYIYSCTDILTVGALEIMWKIPYFWCMCMRMEMTTWYV